MEESSSILTGLLAALVFSIMSAGIILSMSKLVNKKFSRWISTAMNIASQVQEVIKSATYPSNLEFEDSKVRKASKERESEYAGNIQVFQSCITPKNSLQAQTHHININELKTSVLLKILYLIQLRRFHSPIAIIRKSSHADTLKFTLDAHSHIFQFLTYCSYTMSFTIFIFGMLSDQSKISSYCIVIVLALILGIPLNVFMLSKSYQKQTNQVSTLEKIQQKSFWQSRILLDLQSGKPHQIDENLPPAQIGIDVPNQLQNDRTARHSSTGHEDITARSHINLQNDQLKKDISRPIRSRSEHLQDIEKGSQNLEAKYNLDQISDFLDQQQTDSSNNHIEGLFFFTALSMAVAGYLLFVTNIAYGGALLAWIISILFDQSILRTSGCYLFAIGIWIRLTYFPNDEYKQKLNTVVNWEISVINLQINTLKRPLDQTNIESKIPSDIIQNTVNKIKQSIKKITSPAHRDVPHSLPFKHLAFSQVQMPNETEMQTQQDVSSINQPSALMQPKNSGRLQVIRTHKPENCQTGEIDISEDSLDVNQEQKIKVTEDSTCQNPRQIQTNKSQKKVLPSLKLQVVSQDQSRKQGIAEKGLTDRNILDSGRNTAKTTINFDESLDTNTDSIFNSRINSRSNQSNIILFTNQSDVCGKTRREQINGRKRSSRSNHSRNKDFNVSVDQQNLEFQNRNRLVLESSSHDFRVDESGDFSTKHHQNSSGNRCDLSSTINDSQCDIHLNPNTKIQDNSQDIFVKADLSVFINGSIHLPEGQDQKNNSSLGKSLPPLAEGTERNSKKNNIGHSLPPIAQSAIHSSTNNNYHGVGQKSKRSSRNSKRESIASLIGILEAQDARIVQENSNQASTFQNSLHSSAISSSIHKVNQGEQSGSNSVFLDSQNSRLTSIQGGSHDNKITSLQITQEADAIEDISCDAKVTVSDFTEYVSPTEGNRKKKKKILSPIPPTEQKDIMRESTPRNRDIHRRLNNHSLHMQRFESQKEVDDEQQDSHANQILDFSEEEQNEIELKGSFVNGNFKDRRPGQPSYHGGNVNDKENQPYLQEINSPNSINSTFAVAAKSVLKKQENGQKIKKRKESEIPQPYLEQPSQIRVKDDRRIIQTRKPSKDLGNKFLGIVNMYGFEVQKKDSQPRLVQKRHSKSVHTNLNNSETNDEEKSTQNIGRSSLADISAIINENKRQGSASTASETSLVQKKHPIHKHHLPHQAIQNNLVNRENQNEENCILNRQKPLNVAIVFDFEAQSLNNSPGKLPHSNASTSLSKQLDSGY